MIATVPASSGPARFARYAGPPNRHGYCGPDPVEFAELARSGADASTELRRSAQAFEGAYPYLELLAGAVPSHDPLDDAVVEAYWLGNGLLDRIGPGEFGRSLDDRFRRRAGRRWYRFEPAVTGGCANHAFHVLVASPWIGLMRQGIVDEPLEIADRCRISWGRVRALVEGGAVVDRRPLRWAGGRLQLGPAEPVPVSSMAPVSVGDVVSLHWGVVCDVLTARQLASLVTVTRTQLDVVQRIGAPV
jgi:hypothetical protein